MGCNCRKPKPPTGFGVTPKKETKAPESSSPASPPPTTDQEQNFTMTDGAGRTQSFGSKLERDAAMRRQGFARF